MPRLASRVEALTAMPVVSVIQSASPPPRLANVRPTPAHMAQSRAIVVSKSGMVALAMAIKFQRVARVMVPLFTNPLAASAMMVVEFSVGKEEQCPERRVAPRARVRAMSSPPGPMAL